MWFVSPGCPPVVLAAKRFDRDCDRLRKTPPSGGVPTAVWRCQTDPCLRVRVATLVVPKRPFPCTTCVASTRAGPTNPRQKIAAKFARIGRLPLHTALPGRLQMQDIRDSERCPILAEFQCSSAVRDRPFPPPPTVTSGSCLLQGLSIR